MNHWLNRLLDHHWLWLLLYAYYLVQFLREEGKDALDVCSFLLFVKLVPVIQDERVVVAKGLVYRPILLLESPTAGHMPVQVPAILQNSVCRCALDLSLYRYCWRLWVLDTPGIVVYGFHPLTTSILLMISVRRQ